MTHQSPDLPGSPFLPAAEKPPAGVANGGVPERRPGIDRKAQEIVARDSWSRLLSAVACTTGEPVGIVEQILDAAFDTIREDVCAGRQVVIDGFGKFRLKEVGERIEPRTDETIIHPPYRQPFFKADHAWRKAANTGREVTHG